MKIICCDPTDYKRRCKNWEDIKNKRAAYTEMTVVMLFGIASELIQRITDIPYVDEPRAYFGDCDGLRHSRTITKPKVYYQLFMTAEILGFLFYWIALFTVEALKKKIPRVWHFTGILWFV